MRTNFLILLLLIYFHCNFTYSQQTEQSLNTEVTINFAITYLLYLPEDYSNSSEEYPLLLFLHGAGERGNDLELVKRHGPPKLIEEGKKFPFITVSPQCPERMDWDNRSLIVLLDYIESHYRVDKNRIYITGLSMGGHATWSLAIQYSKRFAAMAPVCGKGYTQDCKFIKDIPVWSFHGQKDDVVPITDGQKMITALEKAGGNVQFTIYPEAGHDAWTETYNNPELYEWLLKNKKEN